MGASHRIRKSGRMKGREVDGVLFVHLSLPTGLGGRVGRSGPPSFLHFQISTIGETQL